MVTTAIKRREIGRRDLVFMTTSRVMIGRMSYVLRGSATGIIAQSGQVNTQFCLAPWDGGGSPENFPDAPGPKAPPAPRLKNFSFHNPFLS